MIALAQEKLLADMNLPIKMENCYTALCADLKPREIFESVAKQRFQKFLCTTLSLNRLYVVTAGRDSLLRNWWIKKKAL